MILRHRLELRYVQRGENVAQSHHPRGAVCAIDTGRGFDRIASVEQDRAALLHVAVDMFERLARRLLGPRNYRPIDQRIERELVARGIEPDWIAGFERSALRQKHREPLQPRFADPINLGIARNHIGEARLQRGAHGRFVVLCTGGGSCRQHGGTESGDCNRGGGGAAPAAQHARYAASEPEYDQRVQCQKRQGGKQYRPAQILRFAHSISLLARVERRNVEPSKPIGWGERVHRQKSFGRSVEAGRVVGACAADKSRRNRPSAGRRRAEYAEAVENSRRGYHVACRAPPAAGRVRVSGRRRAGQRHDPLEHFDEGARQRQVGPARVGGDVEEHDHALAAPRRGHQRRTVAECRPCVLGKAGVRGLDDPIAGLGGLGYGH